LKYFWNIHIYEADWNAMICIKWKEALKESEDSNMLQPNQFGSRKQKSTMQPLQLEISQIEISRLSRQQYCQINHDARACYDRILPNIAALASRKYGVYKDLVNLHYKTLTNTKYRIKITGGNKTFVFSNSSKTPIYGTRQGSNNSPIIWLFISDTIAQIMETSAIRASYATDDSQKSLNLKMTTYVDDVNTHHTNTDESNNIEYNMRHDYNKLKLLWRLVEDSLLQKIATTT
jgi:hypothetical protein